jgi:hypothetical protein
MEKAYIRWLQTESDCNFMNKILMDQKYNNLWTFDSWWFHHVFKNMIDEIR